MSDSYIPDNEPRYILLSLEELASKKLPHAPTFRKAADEITRLRAERDALKDLLPNQSHEGRAPIPTDWWSVAVLERRKRRAAEKERDALKAELELEKAQDIARVQAAFN